MLTVSRALFSDLPMLRDVAVAAFLDDERYKPATAVSGGPPGHDSLRRHELWLRSHEYFKCVREGTIIAGCIVIRHENQAEIFGIFVRPDCMGQGIGSHLIAMVQTSCRGVTAWTLQTPDYAVKNHAFYVRNGFFFAAKTEVDPDLGFGFFKFKKFGGQHE